MVAGAATVDTSNRSGVVGWKETFVTGDEPLIVSTCFNEAVELEGKA